MFGLDDIIGAALKIIDKVIPDPKAKMEAQLQVMQLKQAGDFKEIEADLQMAQMQADVNKVEAASPSIFVAGWRPYVGWVTGSGLAYDVVVRPIFMGIFEAFRHPVNFPTLDTSVLLTILTTMLGMGAYRSWEKGRGIDTKNI